MTRPTRRNSRSSKPVDNSAATATLSTTSSAPTRSSSTRKAGGGGGVESTASSTASSPRGNAKKIKLTNDDDVPLPPPPPQEEEEFPENPQDTAKRQRAMELLRSADDLPLAYAALKLVKEIGMDSGKTSVAQRISRLSAADQALIQEASLAVPYLMYKLCVEEFTQPRAQGGLAYSHAKAVEVAGILFEKVGPACCCAAHITELQLAKKCSSSGSGGGSDNSNNTIITKNDARKVLPILKKIGVEARSKVDETIAKLKGSPLNKEAEEEAPQSNEAKITSEKETQQEESSQQAGEAKVDDEVALESLDL